VTEHDGGPQIPEKSVAAGGVQSLAFRGAEVVLQLALVAITARLMEPEGRGLYALASFTATACGLVLGSVWTANAIELAKGRATVRELRGTSLVIAAVGGSLIALVAVAFSFTVGDPWVVAYPALTTPFLLLSRYQQGLFQALGHVRAVNLILISRVALPLAFITPALLLDASVQEAIGIWALSLVAVAAMPYAWLHRLVGPARFPRDRDLYRRLITVGLKLAPGNSAALLNTRIGLVVLAIFTTEATVGVFSVATAVGEMLLLTAASLSISSFKRIASDDLASSAALTARSVRHAILLALVGAAVLVPAAAIGLPWVIGDGYEDVPLLVALLAPGMAFKAALIVLNTFVSVQAARPGAVTLVALLGTGLTVALTFALVPFADANGAAIASSVAAIVTGLVTFRIFTAESGEPARVFTPGRAELRDYAALVRRR
jgi:O-antigen/teichoic acid export membrane protein